MGIQQRDFELYVGDDSLTAIEARAAFLETVLDVAPGAAADLLRLYNKDSLGASWHTEEGQIQLQETLIAHARKPFLKDEDLVRLGHLSNLLNTPIHELVNFCTLEKEEFDRILPEVELEWGQLSREYCSRSVSELVIARTLRGWKHLRKVPNAEKLVHSLNAWALKWNLTAPWCLDFAIKCLIKFKIDFVDSLNSSERFKDHLPRHRASWLIARASSNGWIKASLDIKSKSVFSMFEQLCDVPANPEFRFRWIHDGDDGRDCLFEVVDRISNHSMSSYEFVRQVEGQLWHKFMAHFATAPGILAGATECVRDNLRRFSRQLEEYVKQCKARQKDLGATAPRKSRSDDGLRYLAKFQVANESFKEIALENGIHHKAVEMAARAAAKTIKLKVRPQKRSGRPVGVREMYFRRR